MSTYPIAPTERQINEAVATLRDLAGARGWNALSVEVRPDGRVEARVDGARAFADLLPGGAHPSPGEVLARA
jgi:hypothetical protein